MGSLALNESNGERCSVEVCFKPRTKDEFVMGVFELSFPVKSDRNAL
jgi:hypothetical protein